MSVPARQVAEVRGVAEWRLYAMVANPTRQGDASLPGDLSARRWSPRWSGRWAAAIDDALGLFARLMQAKLISSAKRATNNDRLSTLPRLEKAVWRVLGTSPIWTWPRCGER
ncbi:hypothetical protein [Streptomyces cucumeris]|uniref:hypothetical protein n=1 Tax=Streptomyces cucumeris TaxID=2962890 RepID=UPI003D75EAA2